MDKKILKKRSTIAKLKEALATKETEMRELGDLLALSTRERNDFASYFHLLFKGVSEGECEDMDKRIHAARLFSHHIGETGTTPSVYAEPKLVNLSKRIWESTHEHLRKHSGTNDDVIVRDVHCKECGLSLCAVVPLAVDQIECPKCKVFIRVGGAA